ncbi:MAG: hypothetical protein HY716_16795 [Planctomycetes bacterium]|nr:hypothetical protein [Planctomycetota bacterium]
MYRDSEGKRLTIPVHTGRTLHPKIVKAVMRDAGLTPQEL